jgi:hypothetical protein
VGARIGARLGGKHHQAAYVYGFTGVRSIQRASRGSQQTRSANSDSGVIRPVVFALGISTDCPWTYLQVTIGASQWSEPTITPAPDVTDYACAGRELRAHTFDSKESGSIGSLLMTAVSQLPLIIVLLVRFDRH